MLLPVATPLVLLEASIPVCNMAAVSNPRALGLRDVMVFGRKLTCLVIDQHGELQLVGPFKSKRG